MTAHLVQAGVLATHMTGGIETRALLTLGLLVAGLLIAVGALIADRRGARWTTILVGVAMIAAGGLSGANTTQRHHIHLCHEHGLDTGCGPGHRATGGVDHDHLLGRW
jgi:nitrate/nitrite transporter NarK